MTVYDSFSQAEELADHTGLTTSPFAEQLQYWRSQLEGVSVPELPIDQSLQTSMTPTTSHEFEVPPDVATRMADLSHLGGVSLLELTVAAFQIVLAHYTGQDDIAVATPAPGQGYPLVLRSRVTNLTSFLEFAVEVQATVGAAFTHSDVPFECLVKELGLESELARAAVVCEHGAASIDADITVRFVERGNELSGSVEYLPEKFDAETIERMAAHLVRVLNVVTANPSIALGQIDLLADDERRQMLAEWNDTGQVVAPVTLPELLQAQVARTPEATAVVFEGLELSYAELNARANRLAHKLIAQGVGPECCVAVALPRSVELIIALWAVLKAGAAYLPVDPDFPSERIRFVLDDASPVVVFDDPLAIRDTDGYPDTNPTDADRIHPLEPINPAYVIYTSGSTGRPKGVVVPHCGIVNRLLWMQAEYGLREDDRVLQKTPSSFDVSVWEFFWPFIVGATLVVAKPEGHKDPAYLTRLIRSEAVTTIHFVPSMLRAFLQDQAAASCTGLRRVICSGEALPADLARDFHSALDVGLHNLYGPTEASVDVTYFECVPQQHAVSVPIGRAAGA